MSTTEVVLFVSLLVFAGFRLYQRYAKKNTGKPDMEGRASGTTKKSSFGSHSGGDDYEPYSKK